MSCMGQPESVHPKGLAACQRKPCRFTPQTPSLMGCSENEGRSRTDLCASVSLQPCESMYLLTAEQRFSHPLS